MATQKNNSNRSNTTQPNTTQQPNAPQNAPQHENQADAGVSKEILAELQALRKRVEELEGTKPVIHSAGQGEPQTPYERNLGKLNAKLAQQKHATEQAAALLEEGEFKFSVSVDKEPMMTRVVGATTDNEHEAIRKYNLFFGIRSSNKEIRAARLDRSVELAAK